MSIPNKSLSKYPPSNSDRSISSKSKIATTPSSQTQPSTQPKSTQFMIKQEPCSSSISSPSELDTITELGRSIDFLPELLNILNTSSESQSSLTIQNSFDSYSGANFSSTNSLTTSNLSTINPYSTGLRTTTGLTPLPSPGAVDGLRVRVRAARDLLADGSLSIPSLESNVSTDQRRNSVLRQQLRLKWTLLKRLSAEDPFAELDLSGNLLQ
jgi:hypothetical protein